MKFRICDLILESDFIPASFLPFSGEGEPELHIKKIPAPIPRMSSPAAVHPDFSVFRLPKGWLLETPQGEQLAVDSDYREARLYIPWDTPLGEPRQTLLLRVCIECQLIHRGFLSLHAACVVQEGRAVAFTGVSGTGKSTRAAQWVNMLDAQWLSGDRPSLSIAPGRVYGVPWDGKEQIFCPGSAPLAAILDVHRSPFTRIRRLSRTQARRVLMQQCFVPMWDTDTAERAMALIGRASEQLPICRLLCDQDEQAALETCDILLHHPERICPPAPELKLREDVCLLPDRHRTIAVLSRNREGGIESALALNETAAFLLQSLKTPLCREDLLALLGSCYQVDPVQAEQDLENIKHIFLSDGIVQELP